MTKRLTLAIQNILDIQHKIRAISIWNSSEVHHAFAELDKWFHKEPESTIVSPGMHVHDLSCWKDENGQDQFFKICTKLDYFEQQQKIEDLEREVKQLSQLLIPQ